MDEQDIKKFLRFKRIIYIYSFVSGLNFLLPVFAIMFTERGVSYDEISILFIIWSVGVIAFSLPVGLLADRYSRKGIVIIGKIAQIICLALWFAFPNFWGFLCGFFLSGLEWVAKTSIFEAFLYDELKSFHREKEYSEICGKVSSLSILAYLAASCGSFMLPLGYGFIFALCAFFLLISICCLLLIHSSVDKGVGRKRAVPDLLLKGTRILKYKPQIAYMMLLIATIVGLGYVDEYFGLVGLEIGLEKNQVGFIFIVIALANATGSWLAHFFQNLSFARLMQGVALLGLLFTAVFFLYNLLTIIILMLFFFCYGVVCNLLLVKYQRMIDSKIRGLMMGYYSLIEQITTILSYLIMMWGYHYGNYSYGFLALGIIVFSSSFIFKRLIKG